MKTETTIRKWSKWTPAKYRRLYKLWNEDLSNLEIMRELSIPTKNSLIGAVHRMKRKYGKDLKWNKRTRNCKNGTLPKSSKEFMKIKMDG